jgi:flavin reductase (DIM6/NTAB) family NADH-FMN oxidoreductase RutF
MKQDFVDVRALDNFYQTSSFFPMPVVLVSTVAESGQTNLGPYSLCFPHFIADKHGLMLISRADSNTSQNIQRNGVCALNFVPDKKDYMENCVMLGYPGESTSEKMKNSAFTLIPSTRSAEERQPGVQYPEIVREAVQVFECTWDSNYPLRYDEEDQECRFALVINKIVLQKRWRDSLLKGEGFPRLPVCYGFRNNRNFWFSRHSRPYAVPIPKSKAVNVSSVMYAVTRYDPDITWQEAACEKLVRVPRIFLSTVIAKSVEAARAEGLTEITPEFLDRIRDKRSADKKDQAAPGRSRNWLARIGEKLHIF